MLRGHFPSHLVEACQEAFWTRLFAYLGGGPGPSRDPIATTSHALRVPCFTPEFFFDPRARHREWSHGRPSRPTSGVETPLPARSTRRHTSTIASAPSRGPDPSPAPVCAVVNFGLVRIARESGPMEITAGTDRWREQEHPPGRSRPAKSTFDRSRWRSRRRPDSAPMGGPSGTPGCGPIAPPSSSRSGTSAAGIRTPAEMWSRYRVSGGINGRPARASCGFRSASGRVPSQAVP